MKEYRENRQYITRMMSKSALFLVLTLSCITNSHGNIDVTEREEFKRRFSAFVQKRMKKHKVTGLSVAIEVEGQIVLNEGYGFSNKSKHLFTTKDTKYPIGSVSKIVAATSILKLWSDGIIDIDKPYTQYVDDFSMKSHFKQKRGFTIRHLLSHYAGLPRLKAKGFLKKTTTPLEGIIADSKDEYLIAPPGKVYQYSDWAVDLLAVLVQRVSGMAYEDYVREKVFIPLNMDNSNFGPIKETKGYKKGNETETYNYSYNGSDGVVSTPSDLLRLAHLFINNGRSRLGAKFLKPSIAADAITQQFVDASLAFDTETGLVWDVRQLKSGPRRIKLAGIHEPFFTYIFFIPEYNASFAISSNSNSSSKILWDCWSRFFSFVCKKHDLNSHQGPDTRLIRSQKILLSNEKLARIEGSYSTNLGILNLKRKGKRFDVSLGIENKQGIAIPYSGNLMKLYVKILGIRLHVMDVYWKEVEGEMILGEQFRSGARRVFGSKINQGVIPDIWREAVGLYKVANYGEDEYKTFDTIRLFINKRGFLEINGNVSYPTSITFQLGLTIIDQEFAIIPGYNFDFFGGETIKLYKYQEGFLLRLSGYQFVKIAS